MKYYIAYGSNLNMRQMLQRCPGAVVIGKTWLEGYRLTFRGSTSFTRAGVANIEPRPGSRVPVGIWRITEAHERSLDRYEGFPHLYYKQEFSLVVDGNRITAMAYIMTPGRPWAPPIQPYLRTIRQGYQDFDITSDRNLIYAAGHPVKGVSKYAASRDPIFQQRPVR